MEEVEFGRYRLLSVIGEGGMGKVYRAHDTMMDRDVAIKVLPPELATEPGYELRFRREAHIAARLTEPHIIPVYESGEINGRLYLVMPIIKGIDAQALLRRDGPMSPTRAVHIVEQLAAALEAAHNVGLVHRDIKPSNALVTARDFVYLIDFGIAHDSAAKTKLTATNTIVGTWAYMAPERFRAGIADARSDVYALACLFHECLTGHSPYPGDSVEQQVAGHLMLDPPRLTASRPDLPAQFDEVIARGLAKDRDRRYQSANELATAAQRALSCPPSRGATTIATPPADATRPGTGPVLLAGQGPATAHPQSVWQQGARSNPAPTQQDPPPGLAPIRRRRPAEWSSAPPTPTPTLTPPPAPAPTLQPTWQPTLQPALASPRPRRRAALIAGILGAAVVLVAGGIGITAYLTQSEALPSRAAGPQSPGSSPAKVPPIAESALEGMLLTPDQINAAMGVSGMTVTGTVTTMPGNGSARVSDPACIPLAAAGSSATYADSGWTAVRGQELKWPANGTPLHDVGQFVVLFPSAQQAAAFFTASTQHWLGCSNRQFTVSAPGTGMPDTVENVGPVTNNNGTLSATITSPAKSGINCQRALTVANNVAIDVQTCNASPSDAVAVSIAHQIAVKASKT